MKQHRIAITGGIGAGKSVVSKVVRSFGLPVYDSDYHARHLMDTSTEIKSRLVEEIHPSAVNDGLIDRALLSEIVFKDATKLLRLNDIVHEHVKKHFLEWCESQYFPLVFIETAILYESGLNRLVDTEWRVEAPEQIRIDRVVRRNGITPAQVKQRIDSQKTIETLPIIEKEIIVNDGVTAILPQIILLLEKSGIAKTDE